MMQMQMKVVIKIRMLISQKMNQSSFNFES